TETLQCGTMEVNLGQLAVQKGADQAIRDFGQRMIEDHRKANQELTEIINLKGASIPEPSNKKGERMAEHLLSLSGTAFDKAYIKHMVRDHKKAVKEFEMETESAGDAELKNWAAGTLPTLKTHLHMAENTEASIGSVKSLSMAR
ncbi:MAG: putative outer membrane protein, partial [Pedosphaera sp.]|nr:putative outer membrane protein [Pedosphaera sp.]